FRPAATYAVRLEASVRFCELVRSLLVANNLTDAIEISLDRIDGNNQRGLKTFKFARPTGYLAIVWLPWQEIALLERLIAVLVDVGTEPMKLHGLRRRIGKTAQLATSAHVVEHGVSCLVGGCHGLVHDCKFLAAADWHWFGSWNRR